MIMNEIYTVRKYVILNLIQDDTQARSPPPRGWQNAPCFISFVIPVQTGDWRKCSEMHGRTESWILMNRQENQEEALAVDPRLREDDRINTAPPSPLNEGENEARVGGVLRRWLK